jgi:carbon-monoxide dehydrogenase large subunit
VIGQSPPRKEDARLLTGRGRYTTDVRLPNTAHVAFVRSSEAHAELRSVEVADALAGAGVVTVVTGDDPAVAAVQLRAVSALPAYVETSQPLLAWPRVRFAGEAIAAVVAEDRYRAEDAAELVAVGLERLPVIVDATRPPPQVPLHEAAPDGVLLARGFEAGDVDAALAQAEVVVERAFRTNRHAGMPLEARAAVADWDPADRTLTLHSGVQMPHIVRGLLAELLGLAESRVRVVAGDVGGGFGTRAALYPEDVVVCLLTMRIGRPVCWREDRIEHLLAANHARDHHYRARAGFDGDGRLVALDAEVTCNVGAYSIVPWTAGLEPLMAGGLLAGPYKVSHYRCDVRAVCTNTSPAGPYRGVARPATTFVMERLLDVAAARVGLDPVEIRRRNLVGPDDVPYTAATRLVHDSPSYPECLERVAQAIGHRGFRAEQAAARAAGRRIGVGFACYNELTGMGKAASAGPRIAFRTGHEACTVRIDPSGAVTVLAGVSSQGQGLQTTLAQIVATALGVDYDDVDVRFGDTREGLFGFGAFASRQGVIGGGAALVAAEAVRARLCALAAHLLEAAPEDLEVAGGRVSVRGTPTRGLAVAEVARVAYLEAHRLPPGLEPGLDATRFYDPVRGAFAAGAQAAVVEVDRDTGMVRILRYACVEDTGNVIHPRIVEGQVEGAIAQGIGGALLEHLVYDDDGNLTTGTLVDYLLPTALDIPELRVAHLTVPADNALGVRGVGEGGTLGPAAALANAVADALGVEITELPLHPARLWAAVQAADEPTGPAGGMR